MPHVWLYSLARISLASGHTWLTFFFLETLTRDLRWEEAFSVSFFRKTRVKVDRGDPRTLLGNFPPANISWFNVRRYIYLSLSSFCFVYLCKLICKISPKSKANKKHIAYCFWTFLYNLLTQLMRRTQVIVYNKSIALSFHVSHKTRNGIAPPQCWYSWGWTSVLQFLKLARLVSYFSFALFPFPY